MVRMMDFEDYTQTLESVAWNERRCAFPLCADDRRRLFADWVSANADAVREMEGWATYLQMMGRRISARYLIEKERHEGTCKLTPIPYVDGNGQRREYAINNSDGSLLARWLLARHPTMNIETRRSLFDGAEE